MVGFISKCLAKYRLVPSCMRHCGKHICLSPLERMDKQICRQSGGARYSHGDVRGRPCQQTSSGTGSCKRAVENAFLWPNQGLSANIRSRTWTNPRTNSSAPLCPVANDWARASIAASCAWLTSVCPDTVFVSFFDRTEDAPCSWQGTPANC
jgi:hypothetical protein